MMGKTHIAAGVASAVAVVQPKNLGECLGTILAGAVGGLICDLDIRAQNSKDARIARIILVSMVAGILLADWLLKAGMWQYLINHVGAPLMIGIAGFATLCIAGSFTPHRSFMHSILALGLLSVLLGLVYLPLVPAFAAGFASHLLLDLTNKKPIQLLYPWKRGLCLKLFYADGAANVVVLFLCCAASMLMLLYFM